MMSRGQEMPANAGITGEVLRGGDLAAPIKTNFLEKPARPFKYYTWPKAAVPLSARSATAGDRQRSHPPAYSDFLSGRPGSCPRGALVFLGPDFALALFLRLDLLGRATPSTGGRMVEFRAASECHS